MKSFNLGLMGALAIAGVAYGQQPPHVVNSDAYQNTAMSTQALFSLTANQPSGFGNTNTASGYQALHALNNAEG